MSNSRSRHRVTDERIPEGYIVEQCEERGYDSPDRWFELLRPCRSGPGTTHLGSHGRMRDVLDAIERDLSRIASIKEPASRFDRDLELPEP